MKRTSLTTAVIAGIAGVAGISNMASAVYLNKDGLGQVLIYPYYTVNADNQTLLSVVNTTSLGKAVKVRFLEAYDSREVLDFNLYMSPYDVWVADVIPVDGGAGIFTNDNSCTVPVVPNTAATAYAFLTSKLSDGGPTDVSRTLEGYVEIIEMGSVVTGGSGTGATGTNTLGAITHVNGVPPGCAQVNNAWLSTSGNDYWNTDSTLNMSSPIGGLFGSGSIIDVANGVIEGYNAEAVDAFYNVGDAAQHYAPGTIDPDLSEGTNYTSYVFTSGVLTYSTFTGSVDAVSSVFMADQMFNEYTVDSTIGASTEWVITFPTKKYSVDPALTGGTFLPPFDNVFEQTTEGDPTTAKSCAPVTLTYWDREEKKPTVTGSLNFSPPVTTTYAGANLCYEVQVITFSQTAPSTVLGSNFVANIKLATGFTSGWALLDFTKETSKTTGATVTDTFHELTSTNGNTFLGLPAVGFSVTQYVNGTLSGGTVLANYAALYPHKAHRSVAAD